jgi:metal-responsive CopG/Arc/MetJ family transcriptional regulator
MQDKLGLDRYPEQIEVEFPEVLFAKFEALCDQKGLTKKEVIRTLVDDFVEHHSVEDSVTSKDRGQLEAF